MLKSRIVFDGAGGVGAMEHRALPLHHDLDALQAVEERQRRGYALWPEWRFTECCRTTLNAENFLAAAVCDI